MTTIVLPPDAVCQANVPQVWVLHSAYTGELNARLGVAERLGYHYQIIPLPVEYDTDAYLRALRCFDSDSSGNHTPYSRLVILGGTGEETTEEIAALKETFGDRLFIVFIASILPEVLPSSIWKYDLITSPQIKDSRVVATLGIPHRITPQSLSKVRVLYREFFSSLPRPIIAGLIGGNTRYCFGFNREYAQALADRMSKIATSLGGTIVATNSRRTPVESWAVLKDALRTVPSECVDWQVWGYDFYLTLLAEADIFIVTGDSLSMCSEASSTGKPLLIDWTEETTESFHRDILKHFFAYGAAHQLTDIIGPFIPWSYTPPDPTGTVSQAIQARLHLT